MAISDYCEVVRQQVRNGELSEDQGARRVYLATGATGAALRVSSTGRETALRGAIQDGKD